MALSGLSRYRISSRLRNTDTPAATSMNTMKMDFSVGRDMKHSVPMLWEQRSCCGGPFVLVGLELLPKTILPVDDVRSVPQVHQGGRGHHEDLQHPVSDVGHGEHPVVAGQLAARLVVVTKEVGLLICPHLVSRNAQHQDPEDQQDTHPDLAHHCGVGLDLVQERGEIGPVPHGLSHGTIMGDWSFLASLLKKVQSHSTVVGKVWMSVLFLFRLFILAAGLDAVWGDEQASMDCNTNSPGCKNACYDNSFPLSHRRFWVLQILFVSLPTLVYLGHVLLVIREENKLRRKEKFDKNGLVKSPKYSDKHGAVKIKGSLLFSYITQLVVKIILEVSFMVGQYYIYGFIFMPSKILYKEYPCREIVACFIPRPTEKSIFIIFMLVVSLISLVLTIVELIYLMFMCLGARKRRASHSAPSTADRYSLSPLKHRPTVQSTFC
ncbi:Gap junction Cx32.2 protein [Merluccius polli]|uniref:Gap junction Cx32.2 protein n=1 Tax=Merluccius polli TaxID=89951 RepID=A0AA47P5B5_MERPO|nr:Gap junction Cx32.2 protein [Merluccius polli]